MTTTTEINHHIEALMDHVLDHDDPDQAAIALLGDIAVRLGLEVVVWPRGDHVEQLRVTSTSTAAAIRALADQHGAGVDGAVLGALRSVVEAVQARAAADVVACRRGCETTGEVRPPTT